MLCPLFLGCLKFLFFKLDTSVKFLCKIVAKSPANRKCFATIVDISARLLYFRVGGSSSAGQLTTGTVCFSPFRGAWLLFRRATHHWNHLLSPHSGVHGSFSAWLLTTGTACFPSFRGAAGLPVSQYRIHVLLRRSDWLEIIRIYQIFHHIFRHKCRQGRAKIHIFQSQ